MEGITFTGLVGYFLGLTVLCGIGLGIVTGFVTVPFYLLELFKNKAYKRQVEADFNRWKDMGIVVPKDQLPKNPFTPEDTKIVEQIYKDCDVTFKNLNVRDEATKIQIVLEALKAKGYSLDPVTKEFKKIV